MPKPVIGGVPRGEDLFGREELIENLWERLERDNVLLVAPRRFGKTGIMYHLLDYPQEGFRPIFINVEHILTAGDFMVELMAILLRDHHFARAVSSLWQGTKGFGRFLQNLPSSIDLGGIKVELREKTDVPEKWISYGERVMSLLSKEEPRLLLLLDEFAVMIDSISKRDSEEAKRLLHWFRSARIAPDTGTRFVIGGSINLISTLDAMRLVDTVNDLSVERLQPFALETAAAYVKAIFASRDIDLDSELADSILELVGEPVPYFLAVLLMAILDRQRAIGSPISADTIKAAFEEDLLGGATSVVFQHYRSRIDQYYPGREAQVARAILGMLSRAGRPVQHDTLYHIFLQTYRKPPSPQANDEFIQLMKKLDNDFYIVSRDGAYDFFSRVLKLWWKTHYGFQGE
ncbi:MAG: hypothetical protein L0229_10680 [Blastocatellia bacterium]|nr:hypothetical protein [Blastocatellia bacterium]